MYKEDKIIFVKEIVITLHEIPFKTIRNFRIIKKIFFLLIIVIYT